MARIVVPEAEAILDKEFPVLDHGFVRLVDYLGGDSRIVAAARVSYGAGTKSPDEDSALIRYLMRNMHTSPFEQVILTFHAKMPIFVARQWIRHRTARINEFSGRYSVMPDEFYLPAPENVHRQSRHNKQGRSQEDLPRGLQEKVLGILKRGQAEAFSGYREMLHDDIARELARINLPLGAYTQWYWQIDLHNLFHFIKLRMDTHAQLEIRQYAQVMAKMARAVAPVAYDAFEEYLLYSTSLSRSATERLLKLLRSLAPDSKEAAEILKSIEDAQKA